jgi:biotin carboxyl carrier protein
VVGLAAALLLLAGACSRDAQKAQPSGGPGADQTGRAVAAAAREDGNNGAERRASVAAAQGAGTSGGPGGRPQAMAGTAGAAPGGPRPGGGPSIVVAEETARAKTVQVAGRLEPKSRIEHKIPVAGYVLDLAVSEGQRVAGGEILLTVERNEVGQSYLPVPVEARIPGLVSKVSVQEGAEVRSGDDAVTLIGTDGYRLEASISDKDAFKVRVGQRVAATSPAGTIINGVLTVRAQEPDYQTGLFLLTFDFPDSPQAHVGEFFLVDLPVDLTRGFFLPRDLVVRRYGKYFIWIVDSDQTLQLREITIGASFGDDVQVNSGLIGGDRYLGRLSGREREGQPVGDQG